MVKHDCHAHFSELYCQKDTTEQLWSRWSVWYNFCDQQHFVREKRKLWRGKIFLFGLHLVVLQNRDVTIPATTFVHHPWYLYNQIMNEDPTLTGYIWSTATRAGAWLEVMMMWRWSNQYIWQYNHNSFQPQSFHVQWKVIIRCKRQFILSDWHAKIFLCFFVFVVRHGRVMLMRHSYW